MQIKGQKMEKGVMERSSSEQGGFQTQDKVEATETITI
jgi:hypothetical protein